jgi:hypothetical protein
MLEARKVWEVGVSRGSTSERVVEVESADGVECKEGKEVGDSRGTAGCWR